jgi:uncharacterized membrane protein YphA (DoxX/SURF4 family)
MKTLSNIVGIALGVLFIVAGLNFWGQWEIINKSMPVPPEGIKPFVNIMYGSGYLAFVKILEIAGGVLLLLPRLRNWGLVIIGAIVVNLACIHQFLGGAIKDPVVIFAIAAVLYLAYAGRRGFCCLACCGSGCCAKDGDSCCSTSSGSSSCCSSDKK